MQDVSWEDELARWHEASFGWAMSCCGFDPAEADEVLQNAYLKILDGRARFRGRSSPRTFLFGVIRRSASERRRRERLRARLTPRAPVPSAAAAPDERVALDQAARVLRDALGGLAARQREALHLVFYQELTIEEAAGVMGVSLGTARTHYERGKRRLRALLSEEGT